MSSTFRHWLPVMLLGLSLCACGGGRPSADNLRDKYVSVNLQVTGPVDIPSDDKGGLKTFTPEQLVEGKKLFESNCQNCHVGGVTTPNPKISLNLIKLQGATPSRDNVAAIVKFIRKPMSYDGTEEVYNCRKTDWLKDKESENLAAFVVRAAQRAKAWGTARLESNQDSITLPPKQEVIRSRRKE